MNHLRVTIPVTDNSIQEILIACLTELGYEGFEQQEDSLHAYMPGSAIDTAALDTMLGRYGLAYVTDILPERNWNEEWERNFSPVVVDDFCAIRAFFHAPVAGVREQLIITPKMSFGTGHHATTYMMIQAMRQLDFKCRRVLDFGTGTGVLAILAERLGAASVLAIDNDDWSIENARENIEGNQCLKVKTRKFSQIVEDLVFDIILANIDKHTLLLEMKRMEQQLTQGGVILIGGLLQEDAENIENEAAICDLSVSDRMGRGGWICLKMEKTKLST